MSPTASPSFGVSFAACSVRTLPLPLSVSGVCYFGSGSSVLDLSGAVPWFCMMESPYTKGGKKNRLLAGLFSAEAGVGDAPTTVTEYTQGSSAGGLRFSRFSRSGRGSYGPILGFVLF